MSGGIRILARQTHGAENRMPDFPTPTWPLLLWCGLAAAIASQWIAGLVASIFRRQENRSASPRLMSRQRGSVLVSILTGTLLFAPLYGIVFELAGRSNLSTGALLGLVHGILATAWSLWAARRGDPRLRPSVRSILAHRAGRTAIRILYGAVLGYLYVVPLR
jgi:hypothetical protein